MTKCFACGKELTPENEPDGLIYVRGGKAGGGWTSVPICTEDWFKQNQFDPCRFLWEGIKSLETGN